MTAPTIAPEPATTPRKPGFRSIWGLSSPQVRFAAVAVAAVAILGIVGTIVGVSIAVQNAANWGVLRDRSAEQAATISQLETERDRAVQNLVPQTELTKREQTVAAAEKSLSGREGAVKAREDAITAKEQFVQKTSLTDGTYTVGVSMEPGTYRTESTGTRCYWAIYTSGTNYDDIVQNDAGSTGVLTVTVGGGQDFRTQRCGTWTKVG